MDLFFGIDVSTQSITGIIINIESTQILFHETLNYDQYFAKYDIKNGVKYFEDPKVIHSYPMLWVDALELLFQKIRDKKNLLTRIKAISGSAQQHGTVYVNSNFLNTLKSLNIEKGLSTQLIDALTRITTPIWMDSSTTKQCEEIRSKLGGSEEVIKITGSNTYERFSGPQIKKFYEENPGKYKETSKIHLISSFLASVLIGKNAPIDYADGSGMNLMNITNRKWDDQVLDATAPQLKEKLPPLVNSDKIIGKINNYFTENYGLSSATMIVAWSGDNPNSLIGTGLIQKDSFAISLGTSDTFFGYMENFSMDPHGEGHVFRAPTGDYMSLLCFKNGSLSRERMKDLYGLTWTEVSRILAETPPGNEGKIILPYFFPEIIPLVLEPRIYRFGLKEDDIEGNIRGIIESQFLSMRLHSRWINERPSKIIATGGASKNREILQIISDIFQAPVERYKIPDSAALGAAFRAAYSYYHSKNSHISWQDIIKEFLNQFKTDNINPNSKLKKLYNDMLELYKKFENYILNKGHNPEEARIKFIKDHFNK